MSENVLRELVMFVVVSMGVPVLSLLLLNKLDAIQGSVFERLSYGWKRFVAVVVAGLFVSVVWLFGLWAGYFEMPQPVPLAWMEAWVAMIFPAGLLQQLLQGFTHKV